MLKQAIAAAMLSLSIGVTSAFAADMGDKDDAIKIPINEWTGQHLSAHILGQLFEKMGYKAEYVTSGAVP